MYYLALHFSLGGPRCLVMALSPLHLNSFHISLYFRKLLQLKDSKQLFKWYLVLVVPLHMPPVSLPVHPPSPQNGDIFTIPKEKYLGGLGNTILWRLQDINPPSAVNIKVIFPSILRKPGSLKNSLFNYIASPTDSE